MNMHKKILRLTLKGIWYDMIAAGTKTEEYREIKPYWEKRLPKTTRLCSCTILSFMAVSTLT